MLRDRCRKASPAAASTRAAPVEENGEIDAGTSESIQSRRAPALCLQSPGQSKCEPILRIARHKLIHVEFLSNSARHKYRFEPRAKAQCRKKPRQIVYDHLKKSIVGDLPH